MGTPTPPNKTPNGAPSPVAQAVNAALAEAGMSRFAASKATGIKRSTMYRKCEGTAPFDADELRAIATLLGVKTSDLMARAERAA